MGKKKNNNSGGGEVKQQDDKQAGGDAGKKNPEKPPLTVVLKVEMHCEGCASKLIRLTRELDGVESAKAEVSSNKLTVVGAVEPLQIRDKLHEKTKKKVELVSPQDDGADKNENGGKPNNSNGKKKDDKNQAKPETAAGGGEKQKPIEVTVATPTTAVLKVAFHCQGCVEKIEKIVSKTKGVQELVAMDKQKETVTVKGTMDVKELADVLKERLKRSVEVVPPLKKEKDGGLKDGDKEGQKKKKGGDGGGETGEGEASRVEFSVQHPGHAPAVPPPGFGGLLGYGNGGYPVYGGYGQEYGYGQVGGYPVYLKFNDENPNACSVM